MRLVREEIRTKTPFAYHQKTVHEGRKDYTCDWCEKKFGEHTRRRRFLSRVA
ncbi:unnamed protein product [Trichogramma brassicae]|uniref:C2H2-type domain-containing protein n=1 Tax=Trichogramma brassicae TaxID=86971 RepID=A0A6H5JAD3_9HYME|nr:unnamed protein product [Trichogramma brassicae]